MEIHTQVALARRAEELQLAAREQRLTFSHRPPFVRVGAHVLGRILLRVADWLMDDAQVDRQAAYQK